MKEEQKEEKQIKDLSKQKVKIDKSTLINEINGLTAIVLDLERTQIQQAMKTKKITTKINKHKSRLNELKKPGVRKHG